MTLIEICERFLTAHEALTAAQQAFDVAYRSCKAAADGIRSDLYNEKTKDTERIQELEKKLAETPRLELQKISERLERIPTEQNTDFWLKYYSSATGTGRINDSERQHLEQRKLQLKKAVALLPITEDEAELARLRLKTYKPHATNSKNLQTALAELKKANDSLQGARQRFLDASKEMKEAFQQMQNVLDPRATAQRNADYMDMVNVTDRLNRNGI